MKNSNSSKIRLLTGIAVILTILSVTGGCKKTMDTTYGTGNGTGGSGGPGTNEVWIQGSAFTPSAITVTAGTTITWTNKDAVGHTVTSDTGVFGSSTLGSNGTFSFTFTTPGTYFYHCIVHPSMTAKVTVN